MDRLIDGLIRLAGRFFRWLFTTRNGWIFLISSLLTLMLVLTLKFRPGFFTEAACGLTNWLLDFLVRVIKENQKSIEYLFCIVLMLVSIVLMFKSLFKKKR